MANKYIEIYIFLRYGCSSNNFFDEDMKTNLKHLFDLEFGRYLFAIDSTGNMILFVKLSVEKQIVIFIFLCFFI